MNKGQWNFPRKSGKLGQKLEPKQDAPSRHFGYLWETVHQATDEVVEAGFTRQVMAIGEFPADTVGYFRRVRGLELAADRQQRGKVDDCATERELDAFKRGKRAERAAIEAQQEKVEPVALTWGPVMEPSVSCHYHHVRADSPFGGFLITWKGHKEILDFSCDESPLGFIVLNASTLEEAKSEVEAKYSDALMRAAPQAEKAPSVQAVEPSQTSGMNMAQRIMHVGGRNPPGSTYVEFGSIQAVEALVRHALRDARLAAPQQPSAPDEAKAELALERIVQVTRAYLPPGGISVADAMTQILEIIDPWPLTDAPKAPLKPATIADAPSILNTNDKAMWVLGHNEALKKAA